MVNKRGTKSFIFNKQKSHKNTLCIKNNKTIKQKFQLYKNHETLYS